MTIANNRQSPNDHRPESLNNDRQALNANRQAPGDDRCAG
jgi:hypothetical protein